MLCLLLPAKNLVLKMNQVHKITLVRGKKTQKTSVRPFNAVTHFLSFRLRDRTGASVTQHNNTCTHQLLVARKKECCCYLLGRNVSLETMVHRLADILLGLEILVRIKGCSNSQTF